MLSSKGMSIGRCCCSSLKSAIEIVGSKPMIVNALSSVLYQVWLYVDRKLLVSVSWLEVCVGSALVFRSRRPVCQTWAGRWGFGEKRTSHTIMSQMNGAAITIGTRMQSMRHIGAKVAPQSVPRLWLPLDVLSCLVRFRYFFLYPSGFITLVVKGRGLNGTRYCTYMVHFIFIQSLEFLVHCFRPHFNSERRSLRWTCSAMVWYHSLVWIWLFSRLRYVSVWNISCLVRIVSAWQWEITS